jgi:hypothetical protein
VPHSATTAKLCFMGHALLENRSGLMLGACLTRADGQAERVAALALIEPFADRPRSIKRRLARTRTSSPANDHTDPAHSFNCL